MKKDRISQAMYKRFKKFKTKNIDHSITLFQVFLKYQGRCVNCKKITVMGYTPQAKNSATIEHIIPLANGGNHTWSNVKLFCYECNSIKNKQAMVKERNIINTFSKPIFSLFLFSIFKDSQNNKYYVKVGK